MDDKVFFCDCGSTALVLSDLEFGEGEKWLQISPWEAVAGRIYTFRAKLRHIWNILRYGHPYKDFVIMQPEQAVKLAEYLLEWAVDARIEKVEIMLEEEPYWTL